MRKYKLSYLIIAIMLSSMVCPESMFGQGANLKNETPIFLGKKNVVNDTLSSFSWWDIIKDKSVATNTLKNNKPTVLVLIASLGPCWSCLSVGEMILKYEQEFNEVNVQFLFASFDDEIQNYISLLRLEKQSKVHFGKGNAFNILPLLENDKQQPQIMVYNSSGKLVQVLNGMVNLKDIKDVIYEK